MRLMYDYSALQWKQLYPKSQLDEIAFIRNSLTLGTTLNTCNLYKNHKLTWTNTQHETETHINRHHVAIPFHANGRSVSASFGNIISSPWASGKSLLANSSKVNVPLYIIRHTWLSLLLAITPWLSIHDDVDMMHRHLRKCTQTNKVQELKPTIWSRKPCGYR